MQEIIVGILGAFLGFVILYFVIKWAIRDGIKEAYGDLAPYIRAMLRAGIKEAHADIEEKEEENE